MACDWEGGDELSPPPSLDVACCDCLVFTHSLDLHIGKLVTPQEGSYLLLPLEVCGEIVEETPAAHVTIIWLVSANTCHTKVTW